jgi:hypothetical protein
MVVCEWWSVGIRGIFILCDAAPLDLNRFHKYSVVIHICAERLFLTEEPRR